MIVRRSVFESYQSILKKEQSPKDPYLGNGRPAGTCVCSRCRKDVPVELANHHMCPDCDARIEKEIAAHSKRVEAHQKAEVKAGRAYYDRQGYFCEK